MPNISSDLVILDVQEGAVEKKSENYLKYVKNLLFK